MISWPGFTPYPLANVLANSSSLVKSFWISDRIGVTPQYDSSFLWVSLVNVTAKIGTHGLNLLILLAVVPPWVKATIAATFSNVNVASDTEIPMASCTVLLLLL